MSWFYQHFNDLICQHLFYDAALVQLFSKKVFFFFATSVGNMLTLVCLITSLTLLSSKFLSFKLLNNKSLIPTVMIDPATGQDFNKKMLLVWYKQLYKVIEAGPTLSRVDLPMAAAAALH